MGQMLLAQVRILRKCNFSTKRFNYRHLIHSLIKNVPVGDVFSPTGVGIAYFFLRNHLDGLGSLHFGFRKPIGAATMSVL